MNSQYYGQIENGGSSYESSYKSNPIKNPSQTSRIQSSHTGNTSSNNYGQYDNNQNFQILKRPSQTPYRVNSNEMSLNQFNYSPNPKSIDDSINDQIAKLRNDVNRQYMEMSNLLGKLKMDVAEANQMRNEAERELQYIREEVMKSKLNKILYENKLGKVLEKYAPYNNLHINVKDVDPLYSLQHTKKDLQSTSNMIYATDMVNEGNVNRIRQLSALAQVGQSLVGESEFIPINDNGNGYGNRNNNTFNFGNGSFNNNINNNSNINNNNSNIYNSNISNNNNNINFEGTFNQGNNNNSKTGSFNQNLNQSNNNNYNNINNSQNNLMQSNEPKILDSYMQKGDFHDMYNDLTDIANINHQMNPENKYKSLNHNFDIDYNEISNRNNNTQKLEIDKLNKMMEEIDGKNN